MDIKLKIIQILPPTQITKRDGTTMNKHCIIGETLDAQYPKKVCLDVFGDDKFAQMNFMVNNIYDISIDINSREYNGRWYTNVSAYGAQLSLAPQPAQPQPMQQYQQPFMPQAPYSQPQQMPQVTYTPTPTVSDIPF